MSATQPKWYNITNSNFRKAHRFYAKPDVLDQLCEELQQELIAQRCKKKTSGETIETITQEVESTIIRFARNKNGHYVWQINDDHIDLFSEKFAQYRSVTDKPKEWIPIHNKVRLIKASIASFSPRRLDKICSDIYDSYVQTFADDNQEAAGMSQKYALIDAKKEVEAAIIRPTTTPAGAPSWEFHKDYLDEFKHREALEIKADSFIPSTNRAALYKHDIKCIVDTTDRYIAELASEQALIKLNEGESREDTCTFIRDNVAKKLDTGHWAIHPNYLSALTDKIQASKKWISAGQREKVEALLDVKRLTTSGISTIMERFYHAKIAEISKDFPSQKDAVAYVEENIARIAAGRGNTSRWEVHIDYIPELTHHLYDKRTQNWSKISDIVSDTGWSKSFVTKRVKGYAHAIKSSLIAGGIKEEEAEKTIERSVVSKLTYKPSSTAMFVNPDHLESMLAFNANAPIITQLLLPEPKLTATQTENIAALHDSLLNPPSKDVSR